MINSRVVFAASVREVESYLRFAPLHRAVVDCYSLQHPEIYGFASGAS